jgi:hypothetical protein
LLSGNKTQSPVNPKINYGLMRINKEQTTALFIDFCVLQTAVDLKEAGYCPVVATDCITSRSEISKISAMDRFRFEAIMMSTAESILFELTRSSKAQEFRAISKLVK